MGRWRFLALAAVLTVICGPAWLHGGDTAGMDTTPSGTQEGRSTHSRAARPARAERRYRITVGDILRVEIWKNPDLNREIPVRPDGKISLALIDDVQAQGLTISELDRQITEKLQRFIRHPDVSISFKKMAGRKIVVLGEVRNPGVYLVKERKTILEAIALAGGTTGDASLENVMVVSGGLEVPHMRKIDLGAALAGGTIGEDFVLDSRDVVYVGSATRTVGRKVSVVTVSGAVENPGCYEIEGTKSLHDAIAMAGGTTSKAVLRSVVVMKGGLENPRITIVDFRKSLRTDSRSPDVVAAAGDIVYVPRSYVKDPGAFSSMILGPSARTDRPGKVLPAPDADRKRSR